MKKETKNPNDPIEKTVDVAPACEYYRLFKTDRNMFCVETVKVKGTEIVEVIRTDPTFMPIAFDQMRRKTVGMFFQALESA
jgi:hypothetical protein